MNSCLDHQFEFVTASGESALEKLSKKEKCVNRNSGKAYTTKSGKIVPERSIKPLEDCRRNCKLKISPEDQNKIFYAYWKKGSYEHRFHFVSKLVKLEPKKRDRGKVKHQQIRDRQFNANYHFIINSKVVKVCKKCFLQTLGENHGFVRNVLVKCWTGKDKAPVLDGRGKHSPKNKTNPGKVIELENHIRRFPISEEYCPKMHTIKYLPDGFNAMKMYDLYAAEIKEPLSKNMYRKILAETGLKFKNQTSTSCCQCNKSLQDISVSLLQTDKDEFIQNDDEVLADDDSLISEDENEEEKEFGIQVEAKEINIKSDKFSIKPFGLEQDLMRIQKTNPLYLNKNNFINLNCTKDKMKIDKLDYLKKIDIGFQQNSLKKIPSETIDQNTIFEIEVDPIIISDQIHEDSETEATAALIRDFTSSKTDERTRRSLLKNSGEAYVTESGKFVPKRTVKPLDKCKSNCQSKISPEDQSRIFNLYWKEGDYKYRLNFVANLVSLYSPKVRTVCTQKNRKFSVNYYLPNETGKIQVCKKCFLQTLGENDGFIKNVLSKCWNKKLFLKSDKKEED